MRSAPQDQFDRFMSRISSTTSSPTDGRPRPLGSQSAFARRNIRRKTPTAISRVNPAEVEEMRSTPIGLIKVDLERA